MLMCIIHGLADRHEQTEDSLDRELPRLHAFGKALAADVLHGEVIAPLRHTTVVNGDDSRMMEASD